MRLQDIIDALGGQLVGDPAQQVSRLASLTRADGQSICFVTQASYLKELAASAAGAVILRPSWRDQAGERALILTDDPYLYYARLSRWWVSRHAPPRGGGVHPTAVLGQGVELHPTARVAAHVVLEDGVHLGEGVEIGAHSVVGAYARIGAHSRLSSRVVFGAGCELGERGILHSGCVIGEDGFGFAPHDGRWEKIEQLGIVRLGHDVDVGANTCIDRGALDDTVIEDGVKLDNLIQIAHNVQIGRHTALAGCVGVAGSARIGAHCTFGGAAMILGHLTIVDHVHVSAASCVMSSILQPGRYSGVFPIDGHDSWERNAATLRQLHGLRHRLRALEKKLS